MQTNPKHHSKSLIPIFFIVFMDLLGFGIVIPILPYYAESFGAGGWEIGLLMTSYSLMQFLFAPFWGRLSDRIGRKPVLMMSTAGSAIAMTGLGFASSLVWLFVFRIFAGICAANISTAYAFVTDNTPEEKRTRAMGLVGAAFGLGFTFGPGAGGYLSKFGFATPMFFAAGLAVFNIFLTAWILHEQRKPKSSQLKQGVFQIGRWKNALKNPISGLAIVIFFLFTIATTQLEVTFAIYMGATFGFDAEKTGYLLLGVGFCMVMVQGGMIRPLSKRFNEHQLVKLALILGAISLFWFALAKTLVWLVPSLVVLAIARGIAQPALSSMASKGAKAQERGEMMGLFHSSSSLARIVGPITAGFLYDEVGKHWPFLGSAIVMVIALGYLFLRYNEKSELVSE